MGNKMNSNEKLKLFEELCKNRNEIPEKIKQMYLKSHIDDDKWVADILNMVIIYFDRDVYLKVFKMFVDEGFDWKFCEHTNPDLFYEFFANNYVAKTLEKEDENAILKRHFFEMYNKRMMPKRFEFAGGADFVLLEYVTKYEEFIKKISYISVFSERFLVLIGRETSEVKKALDVYKEKFNVNFGVIYRVLDELRTELILAKKRENKEIEIRLEKSMELVFVFYTETFGKNDITLDDFMMIYENAKKRC